MPKTVIDRLTFKLDVIPNTDIDAAPEPLFDPLRLAHVRHELVTVHVTAHGTKLVKRRPSLSHEIVGLVDVPLHYLSAAEIPHISDIGVGEEFPRFHLHEVGQAGDVCVERGWRRGYQGFVDGVGLP